MMKTRKVRTNDEWIDIYDNLYVNQKMSLEQVGQYINQHEVTVRKAFERLQLKRRSCGFRLPKFNDKVFDVWTEESAYWLGYIVADGSIDKKKPFLSVSTKKSDKYQLEKLAFFCDFKGKIYTAKHTHKKTGKEFYQCYLNLTSNHLIERLFSLGVYNRKSYLDMPYLKFIPEEFIIPFLMGHFDGDGHVRIRTQNSAEIAWLGGKTVMEEIYQWMINKGLNVKLYKRNDCKLWRCYIMAKNSRMVLCNWYLKLGNKTLERKRLIIQKMIAMKPVIKSLNDRKRDCKGRLVAE